MIPVATDRFRLSARPRMGILTLTSQAAARSAVRPCLLVAHQDQGRAAVVGVAVVRRWRSAGCRPPSPARPARQARNSASVRLTMRHGEDRAHGRAHRLDRIGIAAVADQDHPAAAGRVGGADDGARGCRGRAPAPAPPSRARSRARWSASGVKTCSKTPTTVCGLSRRRDLLEDVVGDLDRPRRRPPRVASRRAVAAADAAARPRRPAAGSRRAVLARPPR